jgi:hypothetical protein
MTTAGQPDNGKLSPKERKLLMYLYNVGVGKDVKIVDMYKEAFGEIWDNPDIKVAQQRLGASISRINTKLEDFEIRPGELKQTYRLSYKPNA